MLNKRQNAQKQQEVRLWSVKSGVQCLQEPPRLSSSVVGEGDGGGGRHSVMRRQRQHYGIHPVGRQAKGLGVKLHESEVQSKEVFLDI